MEISTAEEKAMRRHAFVDLGRSVLGDCSASWYGLKLGVPNNP